MKEIYDAAIVGAGPAGIACALRSRELGLRTIILESGNVLNTIKNYPEGKVLFGVPGYYRQKPQKLISLWEKDIQRAKIDVRACEPAESIKKDGYVFTVTTSREKYTAKSVVLAFGIQGTPNRLGVPGEDSPHVHYSLHDPKEFKGKKVLVVGGGDTAIEASVLLSRAGAIVQHSYRRDSFFRAKEDNVAAFKKSRAKPLFGTNVVSIGNGATAEIEYADGKKQVVHADHVFILVGSKPNTDILEKTGIALDKEGRPAYEKSTFETSIPGIYVIGDLAGTATIIPALYAGFIIAPALLARSRQEIHHA